MKEERLLSALDFLDEDLIAPVAKMRTAAPSRSRYIPYIAAAVAAVFCLLFTLPPSPSGGASGNNPGENISGGAHPPLFGRPSSDGNNLYSLQVEILAKGENSYYGVAAGQGVFILCDGSYANFAPGEFVTVYYTRYTAGPFPVLYAQSIIK